MCKISIIMPIYNPGIYFREALEGILNQTYSDFELICIDDASNDGTSDLIEEFQKRDRRIKVYVHSINKGAAISRNEGISLACGEYIFFVDADDVFETDLLEKMICVAEKNKADLVCINYNIFQDGQEYGERKSDYYCFGKSLQYYNTIDKCSKEFINDMELGPYSKFYRGEFIRVNHLQFQDIKNSNDVYFGLIAIFLSQKISFLTEPINLIHVRNHKSLSRISNNRNPFNNYAAYIHLKDEMEKYNIWDKYGMIVKERFLKNCIHEIKICNTDNGKKYYDYLRLNGLKEMGMMDSTNFYQLSLLAQMILNSFLNQSFESGWISNINYFDYLLKEKIDRLQYLFEYIEKIETKCGVWGAGKNGELFAEFCQKFDCKLEGFIDNDKKKWGKKIYTYPIYSPDDLLGKVDLIIVLNQRVFNEIYEQIISSNVSVRLFSINMYLKYEFSYEQSFIDI